MDISLLRADLCDCEEIHKMQVISFKPLLDKYQDYETNPGAETVEHIRKRMLNPAITHYFILLHGWKIGQVRIREHNESTCFLSSVFILPDYQGGGYVQEAIKQAEALYPEANRWELDTIKQEQKLCYLYEKMGYKRVGDIQNIKDGMDLVSYVKEGV